MESNNADLQLSNLFNVKNKVALVTGGGKTRPNPLLEHALHILIGDRQWHWPYGCSGPRRERSQSLHSGPH